MTRRALVEAEQAVIVAARAWNRATGRAPLEPTTREIALAWAVARLEALMVTEPTDDNGRYVEGSPTTSRDAALSIRRGSLKRRVIDEIYQAGFARSMLRRHYDDSPGGCTDDELEQLIRRSHQSVSSARNALVADGWLYDSGDRRTNRSGRKAVVWALAPQALNYLKREAIHG